MLLERLDAELSETDEQGRLSTYGKVAVLGVVGNEDGATSPRFRMPYLQPPAASRPRRRPRPLPRRTFVSPPPLAAATTAPRAAAPQLRG